MRDVPDLTSAEVRRRMVRAQALGARMIVLSGGEPTIREDIVDLVRFAHGRGLKTGLITNGRRFVYPDFAARLRALGLCFAYVSFHSHSRRAHELSARTDSFRELLAALRRLVGLGVAVTVNTVVTRNNIGGLRAAADLLAGLRPAKIKFSALEPKGAALDDPALTPSLKASARAIAGVLRYGRSRHPGQAFGCEGLPPCLLPDYETLNDDLVTNGFTLFQEAAETGFSAPDTRNRAKALVCFDCARFATCPGVYRGYLAAASLPLKPELRRRSNSFVFAPSGRSLTAPGRPQACPFQGRRARPGVRRLFLAAGGRWQPCAAAPADFTAAEADQVLALGQLYTARGGRHQDLDCGRDLVKLRPAPGCRGCPDRGACLGVYEAGARDAFAPLESEARRLVGRLRGAVLEVGCGAVRFGDLLSARARAGRLRYVGLDPRLPAAPSRPGLRLVRGDIEGFDAPEASFDHVLLLRSYDHIRLPSVAFPRIRRLLRPGGRLSVVDGCAYALVLPRRPPPAEPAELQHYRNHTSQEARSLLEAFGFSLVREVPVRPSGCNEWLLVMRKA